MGPPQLSKRDFYQNIHGFDSCTVKFQMVLSGATEKTNTKPSKLNSSFTLPWAVGLFLVFVKKKTNKKPKNQVK